MTEIKNENGIHTPGFLFHHHVIVNKSHKKQTKPTIFFNTEQPPYQVCGTQPQPIGSY